MSALAARNGNGELSMSQMGDVFAKSGFFQDSRDAAQAIVKIQAGREIGFGPVRSMTGIYIVKGRVSLSADLMAAAVKNSGKYNYRIREHTDERCSIEFFEERETVGTSTFSLKDAEDAGLAGSPTWRNFPRNMLFARAMSNGAKWYCPDVFGGPIYTPDELGAEVDGNGGVLSVPQEPTPLAPQRETPQIEGEPDERKRLGDVAVRWSGLDISETGKVVKEMAGALAIELNADNYATIADAIQAHIDDGIDYIAWTVANDDMKKGSK